MNDDSDKLNKENLNNNAGLDSAALIDIIKNASDMPNELKSHILFDHKVRIWRDTFDAFPAIRNFVMLILFVAYFIKEMWNGDILHKIVDFALNASNGHWNLLIICVTVIAFHFINKKYK
jgi:hypothetical protein